MKMLNIIAILGVILSIAGITYSSMRYIALTNSTEVIGSLAPGKDLIANKIETALVDHGSKSLILSELKSRHEHSASLYSTVLNIISDMKEQTTYDIALWACSSIFFSIILIQLNIIRRKQ